MRACRKVLGLSTCQVRLSLANVLYTPRVSLLSLRRFQSFAPLSQEAEALEQEQYRPRRYDDTGSEIGRHNGRQGQRGSSRRVGQHPNRYSDQPRSAPRSTFDVNSFVNEEGQREELQDDMAQLPEYDHGQEGNVYVSKAETEVKQEEGSAYQPVRWLDYKGKIDNGFLLSMRNVFRFTHLTEVQDRILSLMPIQKDILVRSKTGTGKTLGFLIPAVQRHLDHMRENQLNEKTYPKTNCGVLIVTPTRELAMQIANEARRLVFELEPHGMKCQVLVGGDPKRMQIRRMDRERNDIIVGTPGRLLDFLSSEPGVREMMMSIRTLVLDEMDTLLDMGFKRDIETMLKELKSTENQRLNMMFSATISKEVTQVARKALKHDVQFLNLVNPNDLDVHQTVKQTYIVRDMGEHLKIILSLIIAEQLKHRDGKVIVFFNTTKQVQLYTLLFRVLRRLYYNPHFQQFEIHSKKQQDTRAKVTQAFRTANVGSVLFTSDVSARGVDYPGVTKVIQVGAPVSRDQYIHRVGRTGRAGKSGDATLILAPFEKGFLDRLDDIPIKDHELPDSELDIGRKEKKAFELATKIIPPGMLLETFASLLGYCTFPIDMVRLTKDLPKADEWGFTHERAMGEMENWGLEMGSPTVPRVSDDLLARIIGSGRMERMEGYQRRRKTYGANDLPRHRPIGNEGRSDRYDQGGSRSREFSEFEHEGGSRRRGGRDGFGFSGGSGRGGSRQSSPWEGRGRQRR